MIEIGQYNSLTIARETEHGLYLANAEGEEVLLPNKFVTDEIKALKELRVFVYKDSLDRPVATTQKPKVLIDQTTYLEVKQVTQIGAFLDWGLDKDILLPFSEQDVAPEVGDYVLVYVFLDRATNRVTASANLNKFINNKEIEVNVNDEVKVLVTEATEIGYKCIIENKHWGMLYSNELYGNKVQQGKIIKAFIKKIRIDGKIDLSLQKQGFSTISKDIRQIVLEAIKYNGGNLPLHDASPPEQIYSMLKMSKKNFKKAVGMLYKEKLIELRTRSIVLRAAPVAKSMDISKTKDEPRTRRRDDQTKPKRERNRSSRKD
jgi:hypothetical protein